MRTLVGLLAVTGMRLGEALAVDDDGLDGDCGVLLVRHGKFGKSPLLPLRPSATAMSPDRTIRDASFPTPFSPALLVSQAGARLLTYNVGQTFTRLARRAGLAPCRERLSTKVADLRGRIRRPPATQSAAGNPPRGRSVLNAYSTPTCRPCLMRSGASTILSNFPGRSQDALMNQYTHAGVGDGETGRAEQP
jgi:hypothetical protein